MNSDPQTVLCLRVRSKLADWTKVSDLVLQTTLVFAVLDIHEHLLADGGVRIELVVLLQLDATGLDEGAREAHRLLVELTIDVRACVVLAILALARQNLELVVPVRGGISLGGLDLQALDLSRIPVGIEHHATAEVVCRKSHLHLSGSFRLSVTGQVRTMGQVRSFTSSNLFHCSSSCARHC